MFGQQAETNPVKGKISDLAGNPLPGASIVVEGTTSGTLTGVDGTFTIACPKDKALVISYVGYKTQKITVTSAETITITLEEDFNKIDEILVVGIGYGTMRKSDLTGSIASVSSDNLKQGVVTSAEQSLQGKIAGLTVIQPSGDPSVGAALRIRGGSTLGLSMGDNAPLIVVDGIPGVDLNDINPLEIASVDVLKDASACAIYGSRASNGVIIVTTKGVNKGKSVEYVGYYGTASVAHNLDLLSADDWRNYVKTNKITNATDYGGSTDWQKALEQTGTAQSHTLSFSNASDDGGYHVTLSYLRNDGVVATSHLERFGGSLSAYQYTLDHKLRLEAGVHTNFDSYSTMQDNMYWYAYNLSPVIPIFDHTGAYSAVAGTNYYNAVEVEKDRTSQNGRTRILGYGKAELDILKGLKGVVNVSYEYDNLQQNLYIPTYAQYLGQQDVGFGQKAMNQFTNAQLETYLTYNKDLGVHKFGIMAGYSYLDHIDDYTNAQRFGFTTDLFSYNNLGAGYNAQQGDVSSYKDEWTLVSFYGRVNYSLLGRYLLTATLRDDGSSKFGANNKWGLFPSASVAWRISDEDFMKGISWLNSLKLRVGYGVTGNSSDLPPYKSLYLVGTTANPTTANPNGVSAPFYNPTTGIWMQSYGPAQNANPDLKWESCATTNIGIDFGLFNHITGSIEWYQKNTTNLLFNYNVPVPPYLVGTQFANVGSLSNKGIEGNFNINIVRRKDFTVDANLNIAHNVNEVTKIYNNQYNSTSSLELGSLYGLPGMTGVYSQTLQPGHAVGTFWGPKVHGLDSNGKYIVDTFNRDLGNVQPKVTIGFGMNFTYKHFDLSFSTYGMFGEKVLNATAMIMNDPTRLPTFNVPKSFLTSGIKQTAVPADIGYWVQDASFLRLQSVTLGYTIPINKLGFQKVRIYATGENLFVITHYQGIDPEISIENLASPGIEGIVSPGNNYFYPKPRTYTFGLNLSF
jgi:iron complex outermembrane receptor protein